jgi:hypothetical protein
MKILGIDPGATTGWCVYDTEARRVIASAHLASFEMPPLDLPCRPDYAVLERPRGYGPTRPQVVDCAYVAGRLVERVQRELYLDVHELERREICRRLSDAMHGTVNVRNDATAWAALLALHGGDGAAKKGGPLHGVRSHERAALAVAFAWLLPARAVSP